MKLQDLIKFIDSPSYVGHKDNELCIRINKPSIGPRAVVSVKSINHGFDWDNGRTIIEADVELVPKSDKEALFDMAYDLISALHQEGMHKKRKPWWFKTIEKMYEVRGMLEQMRKINK